MNNKREPPPLARPKIRKREEPVRRSTIEVEAEWLIEDAPRVEIKAAKESARKSVPPKKSDPPRKSIPPKKSPPSLRPAARKSIAPVRGEGPSDRKIAAAKKIAPSIAYLDDPGAEPPKAAPLPTLSRPRGKLGPTIPREEEDSERPPPRRRSKPLAR